MIWSCKTDDDYDCMSKVQLQRIRGRRQFDRNMKLLGLFSFHLYDKKRNKVKREERGELRKSKGGS